MITNFIQYLEKIEISIIDESKIEFIDTKNIDDYIEIEEQLTDYLGEMHLPEYCGIVPFEEEEGVAFWKLWLVKYDGETAGITGLYFYDKYPKDYWLSFYGILGKFWGTTLGKIVLLKTINRAIEMGAENLYLFTDSTKNQMAIKLYKRIGFEYISNVKEFMDEYDIGYDTFEEDYDIVMKKRLQES